MKLFDKITLASVWIPVFLGVSLPFVPDTEITNMFNYALFMVIVTVIALCYTIIFIGFRREAKNKKLLSDLIEES